MRLRYFARLLHTDTAPNSRLLDPCQDLPSEDIFDSFRDPSSLSIILDENFLLPNTSQSFFVSFERLEWRALSIKAHASLDST